MSALGHKRTCAVQKGMSALPPIATAKADSRKRFAARLRLAYQCRRRFEAVADRHRDWGTLGTRNFRRYTLGVIRTLRLKTRRKKAGFSYPTS